MVFNAASPQHHDVFATVGGNKVHIPEKLTDEICVYDGLDIVGLGFRA